MAFSVSFNEYKVYEYFDIIKNKSDTYLMCKRLLTVNRIQCFLVNRNCYTSYPAYQRSRVLFSALSARVSVCVSW